MGTEIAVRFRCNQCQMALEVMVRASVDVFPFRAPLEVAAAPGGWEVIGPDVYCPAHRKIVRAVAAVGN